MITCITCTGNRSVAFDLCKLWMRRQTRQPDQWIVVDDGDDGLTRPPEGCDYIKRPHGTDGHNSLAQNILAAIPKIKGDIILFIEDDDYYRSDYIEMMAYNMEENNHTIFGQSHAIYYNIQHKWWIQHLNNRHASLCQTGIKSFVLQNLEYICKQSPKFIDLDLWRMLDGELLTSPLIHCVGMKGLPGRRGIGMGHGDFPPDGHYDLGYTKFFKLLGVDGLEYFKALNIKPEPLRIPVELQAFDQNNDGDYLIPENSYYNPKLIKQSTGAYRLNHDLTETEIQLNKYPNTTCFVVGKGASLDNLKEHHFHGFGYGPVIAINEAIHTINRLNVRRPQYCLQQDFILGESCYNHHGAMILTGEKMDRLYKNHPHRIVLGNHIPQPSICLAVDIAMKWGCKKIVFLCCDAHAKGITDLAKGIGYSSSRFGDPKRYLDQTKELLMKLNSLDREFVCP